MNCSGRTPSLGTVRKCFMVSPQQRQTMVGPLSGTKRGRAMTAGGGLSYAIRYSAETGGSATGLSATNAWHGAAVDDDEYVRLISAVARLSFRQNARNLHSANGGNSQKPASRDRHFKTNSATAFDRHATADFDARIGAGNIPKAGAVGLAGFHMSGVARLCGVLRRRRLCLRGRVRLRQRLRDAR